MAVLRRRDSRAGRAAPPLSGSIPFCYRSHIRKSRRPAGDTIGEGRTANLKIVSDNMLTVAEFVSAVSPERPVKSIRDFKSPPDQPRAGTR